MNSRNAAILQGSIAYNDCLIIQCLKKLCECRPKSKAEPAYTISSSIAGVTADLSLLAPQGSMELSISYLQAMEASMPEAAFRYVVVHEDGEPLLFTYFQLFTLTSHNFSLRKNKTFIKGVVNFFLDLRKVKVLISGNALRNETLAYGYDKSMINSLEAAELIASVAEKIAGDERASAIILKDIPASASVDKLLADAGYGTPIEDKVMSMSINSEWTGISDYVAALSRKYKARANKILASRSQFTMQQLTSAQLHQYQLQLYRLFKNVADNQAFIFTPVSEDHFTQLKNVYQDNFEVYGYFVNDELAAFYSAFVTTDAYELYYVGLDYEVNESHQLYFNILFSGLERAMHLRRSQLKLGRTSFDAKASLGARPVDMPYFIKTSGIPRKVINWFANYFSTMEDARWKLRHPLK